MNFENKFKLFVLIIGGMAVLYMALGTLFDFDIKLKSFVQKLREARKPHFKKSNLNGMHAICPKQAYDDAIRERQTRVNKGERVPTFTPVPGTMTFSDDPSFGTYLTGDLEQRDELLKDCTVEFGPLLYVPFATNHPENDKSQVVSFDVARKIVKSARPKLVWNFLRRRRPMVQGFAVAVVIMLFVSAALLIQQHHDNSHVVKVRGIDHEYVIGYHTRFGHVPTGRTFKELKADPAVWGIIWTVKTDDPDTELWWDYQCNQDFWRDRCEFVSEGRIVHPSQLGK